MPNPVYQITKLNRPFTYFHTHAIDRKIFDEAKKSHKSLEIDVCMYDDGTIYVGHPPGFYHLRNLPLPSNLPLDTIVKESDSAGLYLVFDIKHVKVIPTVKDKIKEYGVDRCAIHAFVKELSFKPWPDKVKAFAEPHWPEEEMPLDEVLKLKQETGAPLVLSCHGITIQRLEEEGDELMSKVLDIAKGKAECINFFLPKDEIVPMKYMRQLLDNGLLPLASDRTPEEKRPVIYLGSSDYLERCSDPKDFS